MSLNTSLLIALFFVASLTFAQKVAKNEKSHIGRFVHGPTYLSNLTKEEKKEYFETFKDKSLTINQQEEKRLAFAQKHGFADAIKEDQKEKQENNDKVKQERPAVIKDLAAANEELVKIYDNKDQTVKQQQEAVEKLKEKYPHAIPTLYYISRLITGSKVHAKPNKD
uniref:DUF148 domain-containing protein n=1 Tax=Caenorhabditis japonica TaxID=281687 RepID=A0A8R1DEE2_CAEJA